MGNAVSFEGNADFILGFNCIIFGLAVISCGTNWKNVTVCHLGILGLCGCVVVWGDFIGSDIRERFESHLSLLAQT